MKTEERKQNVIIDLTFQFSLEIIRYCDVLTDNKKYVIANQLLRSGTSIGANIRESQNSESRKDFIHKFKIAAKEIEETQYWLLLCNKSEGYFPADVLLLKLENIYKVVNKIIGTSLKNKKPLTN